MWWEILKYIALLVFFVASAHVGFWLGLQEALRKMEDRDDITTSEAIEWYYCDRDKRKRGE